MLRTKAQKNPHINFAENAVTEVRCKLPCTGGPGEEGGYVGEGGREMLLKEWRAEDMLQTNLENALALWNQFVVRSTHELVGGPEPRS